MKVWSLMSPEAPLRMLSLFGGENNMAIWKELRQQQIGGLVQLHRGLQTLFHRRLGTNGLKTGKSTVLSVENFLCHYLDSINLMRLPNKHSITCLFQTEQSVQAQQSGTMETSLVVLFGFALFLRSCFIQLCVRDKSDVALDNNPQK